VCALRRLIQAVAVGGGGLVIAASGIGATPSAHAAGNGSIGVYQVGLSFNNNGPGGGGGFWGWWEFDSPANDPSTGYGGDGQAEGCGHGGGFNGAGHTVYDIRGWYIAPDPAMGGIPTFWASWTETDTFRGSSQTVEMVNQPTGIPAFSVHRPLLQLFGIPTPPGQSFNAQVAWKPAH